MDPFTNAGSFQELLNTQQPNSSFSFVSREPSIGIASSDASVFGTQWAEHADEEEHTVSDRSKKRKWSPTEDIVLISAWLNTSKDPVVGNQQKAITFWKRIADYFAASPKLAGLSKREASCCKQRWGKINETVCRFVGCYNAATKHTGSGRSEDDVLINARNIFFNDFKVKFTLDHAWLELRHDQKWCDDPCTKERIGSKRRKLDDQSANSSTSVPVDDGAMTRPSGVKAAKAKGKSKATSSEDGDEFKELWGIKQKDFSWKEHLNKQTLLESLIAKTDLSELETALKNKLIKEML